MAWQTPKTNWAAADGVRDTDFNRIEGNILELYTADAVRSNITIYVSTTGNDNTGLGTSASPYRTITKALSVIPKNLNGKTVTISIAAGTYAEDVKVKHFSCGTIKFTGSSTVTMNSLEVSSCVLRVDFLSLAFTGSVGLSVNECGAFITSSGNVTTTGSSVGIAAHEGSYVYVGGGVTFNTVTTGISANSASNVYVSDIFGSNVGTSMIASTGAQIAYGTHSATTRAITATSTGGRINTGSQTSSPGGGSVL